MPPTRIVLAALPTMLFEIVRQALAHSSDLEIVGHVGGRGELARLLAVTPAAIAIVGLAEGESPTSCSELLRARPDLTVVAITADGRRAYLCEIRLQVSVMTELSAQGLLAALHAPEGVDRDLHLLSLHRTISPADSAPDN